MRFARLLVWLAALVPVLFAGYWASFASPWPEPTAQRLALREATPRWNWEQWADFQGEPMHAASRALHLAALEIPGASIASAAWVNALLAVLVAVAIAGLLRRTFALQGSGAAFALAVAGALVATPAHGAIWLHGERLGIFLPPLLLLVALSWLQGERWFGLRAFGALVLALLAPFCHTHGAVVFLALLPALFAAGRRAGARGIAVWLVVCLIAGNVVAAYTLQDAAAVVTPAGAAWPDRFVASFVPTALELLERTGTAWLDVLPASRLDELALGGLSWLLPLLLLVPIGDRSAAARAAAAPWWSCIAFGLLLVVCDTLRYGDAPPVGTWREAMFGAFLLPLGVAGLVAARFGVGVLGAAGGAALLLALQDWHAGLEALRRARMHVEQSETRLALPATLLPPTDAAPVASEIVAKLRERGLVPPVSGDADITAALAAAVNGPSSPSLGVCNGGTTTRLHGALRSTLRLDGVQWVFVVALPSGGGAEPRVVGRAVPDFTGADRNVPWHVDLDAPITNESVRAVGYVPRRRAFVALGPVFMPRGGVELVAADVQ